MRHTFQALGVAGLFAILTFACGSDDETGLSSGTGPTTPGSSSGSGASTGVNGTTGGTNSASGGASSGSSGTSSGASSSSGGSSGASSGSSSGGSGSGSSSSGGTTPGTMCLTDSVPESEANNDVGSADGVPLTAGGTASYCGVIDSAGDVDYVMFTLPSGVTEMGLHRYGDTSSPNSPDLQAAPSLDGTEFPFAGPFPVQGGKSYVVKMSTKARAPIKYRLVICAHGGSCP